MDEHAQSKEFAIMPHHESLLPALPGENTERLPFFQALGLVIALMNRCWEYDKEHVGSILSRITPQLQAGNLFIWLDDSQAPLGFAAWKILSLEQHQGLLAAPNPESLHSDQHPTVTTAEPSQPCFIWLTDVVAPFSSSDSMMSLLEKHMPGVNSEAEVWLMPDLAGKLLVEPLTTSESDIDLEARRLW